MWIAKLHDGRILSGHTTGWADIKDPVVGLGYDHRGVVHRLPDNQSGYFFHNSASSDMSGNVKLESRVIGCTLADGTVVRLRFHQDSGEVTLETGA